MRFPLFSKDPKANIGPAALPAAASIPVADQQLSSSIISNTGLEWLTSNALPERSFNFLYEILETPKTYISNHRSASDAALLSSHDIGYVLSIDRVHGEAFFNTEKSNKTGFYRDLGIDRRSRAFIDDASEQDGAILNAYSELVELFRAAQENNKGVLLHCSNGSSRSAALLAAFIAKNNSMNFKEAVEYISQFSNISIQQGLALNICRALQIELEQSEA